jgi:signal transduction histidine kinase
MRERKASRHGQYRRYRRDRRLVLAVTVCFCLMLVSFVVSRTITEIQSRRIQAEANGISQNALAAAEALIAVRTRLHEIVFAMDALRANESPAVVSRLGAELEVGREEVAKSWARYLSIPFYPGEHLLVERVQPDLTSAERALDGVVERLHHRDRAGALRMAAESAQPSIARSDEGLARNLELNRREAQTAATRIAASTRERGLIPEFVGAFFAVAAAYFGVRVLVRYLRWSAEQSAELEQFAGRVAHDIRSPLGSLSIALEVMEKRKDTDSKTRDLLARAARTMQHIRQLIDDLLVFATAGGYLVPGEWGERKSGVRDVLDGVVDDASLEAEKRRIQVVYEKPDPALVAACGPGVLISVATNLVSNAMKFIGDSPVRRITISARQVRNDVRLEVSDTGPGIAPELRDRVFQPHVRGTSPESGFGLGLATVKRLVVAHGGAVGVEPSPEGGCRFWVRLPVWTEARGGRRWALPRLSRAVHGT